MDPSKEISWMFMTVFEVGKMKKAFGLLTLLLCLAALAFAQGEVSSELTLREVFKGEQLTAREYVNADGQVTLAEDLGYARIEYIYKNKVLSEVRYEDASGALVDTAGGWARMTCKRGQQNILLRRSYFNTAGALTAGPEGWAEEVNTYQRTSVKRTEYLDAEGNFYRSPDLPAVHEFTYQSFGVKQIPTMEQYLDADGNLTPGPEGWARVTYDLLKNQEVRETAYYGADGRLMVFAQAGYARCEKTWDSRAAHWTRVAYFDADDQLMAGPDGWAYADYDYKNGKPYTVRERYYQADGEPYRTEEGYCGCAYQQNGSGQITAMYFYDGDGNRMRLRDGSSGWTKTYAARSDRVTAQTWLDPEDRLYAVPALGYAKVKYTYDNQLLSGAAYFGADDKPALCHDGYHRVAYVLKNRQVVGERYFGTDDKPAPNADGYAAVTYALDAQGRRLSETYQNAQGADTPCAAGYHRVEYRYDEAGRLTETIRYDLDGAVWTEPGKPYAYTHTTYAEDQASSDTVFLAADGTPVSWGDCWTLHCLLDEQGRPVEEHALDEQGHPVSTPEGAAILRRRFGADGDCVYVAFRTAEDEPAWQEGGYAALELAHDEKDRVTFVRCLDDRDQPVVRPDGTAALRRAWHGAQVAWEACYDTENHPVRCAAGYASVAYAYDADGRCVLTQYYDENSAPVRCGEGYAALRRAYDEYGNVAVQAWLDEAGQLMPSRDGWAEIRRSCNARGQVLEETYFGADGLPYVTADGFAGQRLGYDAAGNPTVQVFLGADGNPAAFRDSFAEIHRVYNERRQVIEERYYGADGLPYTCPDGYAGMLKAYDAAGNVILQIYLDAEGARTPFRGSYAEIRCAYDAEGRMVRTACFDTEGMPYMPDGYAAILYEYGEDGSVLLTYLDAAGQPAAFRNSYTRVRRTTDEAARTVKEFYFDADSRPYRFREGYAGLIRTTDEAGNIISYLYLDEAGEKTLYLGAYAELRRTFNEQRQVTEERYYGVDGEPCCNAEGIAAVQRVWDGDQLAEEIFYDLSGEPLTRGSETLPNLPSGSKD